ncbi:uncharacterized protein LOC131944058 [Physella acuta]|uniref:uncharacterized protein LOC131944058 n=1 Tax=Physella acuta TaxID=109671 RepID=UPI0027DD334E|nr:uncharacterized protein LOC131944058 [Physella acuta]
MDLFSATLLVLAGLISLGHCSACPPTAQDVEKCFSDNHMSLPANFDMKSPSVASKLFCDQPDNAANAIACVFQLAIDCSSSESMSINLADYLPSPSKAKDMVSMSCRNISLIDETCTASKLSSVTACAASKAADIARSSSFDLEKIMCKSFEVSNGCIRPALESCGCATVQLQEEVMTGPMWPSKCPRPDFRTVQCDPNDPKSFLGGSGTKMIPNTMLLFILFCILMKCYKQ